MTPAEATPCEVIPGMVHLVIIVLQSVTAVVVAWLANRAKNRDRDERRRNGHDSHGK